MRRARQFRSATTLLLLVACGGGTSGSSDEAERPEQDGAGYGAALPGEDKQYGGATDYGREYNEEREPPARPVCDGACQNGGQLTDCTCAPEDPCAFAGDGKCDVACVSAEIVAEMFDDTADCDGQPPRPMPEPVGEGGASSSVGSAGAGGG